MMKYGNVDRCEKPVSRMVLGTFGMSPDDMEPHFKRMDTALELGITTFDTAAAYGSEPTVGQWMRRRGNREKVVILTKGAHPNRFRKRVYNFDITTDLYDSLAMLGTDYIDLYLLHRDDMDLPVGPIVECLNEHYRAGRIRAFGGSNWTAKRIAEANKYAKDHGLMPFCASSPNYSLAQQFGEPWAPGCVSISGPEGAEDRKWYMETQMPVFAYSSMARGILTGRITRDMYANHREQIEEVCARSYCHELNFKRVDRLAVIAAEKNVTIPQVAMAYIMNEGLNTYAIIGAMNAEEMNSSIGGLDITLTKGDIDWLDLRTEERN